MIIANCRKVIKPLLGSFYLIDGRIFDVGRIGLIDGVFAEVDQLTAQEEVMDRMPVIAGVNDCNRAGRKPGQVTVATNFRERLVIFEKKLKGRRICFLTPFKLFADGIEDPAM